MRNEDTAEDLGEENGTEDEEAVKAALEDDDDDDEERGMWCSTRLWSINANKTSDARGGKIRCTTQSTSGRIWIWSHGRIVFKPILAAQIIIGIVKNA